MFCAPRLRGDAQLGQRERISREYIRARSLLRLVHALLIFSESHGFRFEISPRDRSLWAADYFLFGEILFT